MLRFSFRACVGRFGRLLNRLCEKFLKIGIIHIPKQTVQLNVIEPGAAEIYVQSLQCIHFGSKHIIVPRRCFRHLIVCNAVGPNLSVRQVIDKDAGHFIHSKPFCGFVSGVSCDDGAFLVD